MFSLFQSSRTPYRLGLALSGGGARGFAHAGALQALDEAGLKPDIIAGVSAGSVAAVLYAAGVQPREIVDIFADASFSKLCEISVPKNGFFSMEGFKKLLGKHVGCERLEDLPIPTIVCATDMDRGEPIAFDQGPLTTLVSASCSIPIIFKPVKYNGSRLIDGGVLHNLPSWAIREKCKYLLGFNVSPLPKRKYKDTLLDIAQASYNLAVKTNTIPDMALCDLAVSMQQIADYKVFNLREINKVFKQGYEITRRALQDNGFKII